MSNVEKLKSYTIVEKFASGIVVKKGYSDKKEALKHFVKKQNNIKEILEEIKEFRKDNGIYKYDNFDIPQLSKLINQIGSNRIVNVALFDNLENGKCLQSCRINFGLFPTYW